MPKPVHIELFHHDGRGPELQEVHWQSRGTQLVAIDYYNPEDEYTPDNLKHVYFSGFQAVNITPEEVIGTDQLPTEHLIEGRAAIFDMGRTSWLKSFSQRHLDECRHFKILLYDELFDVICEDVECRQGGFESNSG